MNGTVQNTSALQACLIVLAVGTSVGWTSPTLKKLATNTSELILTDKERSWLPAMHEPGHVLATLPASFILSRWGPLWCLRIAGLLSICGWLLTLSRASFMVLCAARVLFGMCMGVTFTVAPLYLGEIASPKLRGLLTTCFQSMLYLGHLVEFILGPALSYDQLALTSLCIPIIFLGMSFLIVDSPYFLLKKGQYETATSAYSKLTGLTNLQEIELQLNLMQDTLNKTSISGMNRLKEAISARHRGALITVVGIAVLQRFSGMSAVVAYAALTFPTTTGGLNSSQYTIVFGAIVFLFTFVAAVLIDSFGRRRLTMVSCLGCCVAELVAALYFFLDAKATNASWIPFAAITSYACFYAIGLGPIVSVLQGEMFAHDVKATSSAIVTIAHACSSVVVTKTYHEVKNHFGVHVNFFIFSFACLSAFIFISFYMTETKRKTLQEVQEDQMNSRI